MKKTLKKTIVSSLSLAVLSMSAVGLASAAKAPLANSLPLISPLVMRLQCN